MENPKHDLKPLAMEDTVSFRGEDGKSWSRLAKLTNINDTPRLSEVLTDHNTLIRGNRRHLLPSKTQFELNQDDEFMNLSTILLLTKTKFQSFPFLMKYQNQHQMVTPILQ